MLFLSWIPLTASIFKLYSHLPPVAVHSFPLANGDWVQTSLVSCRLNMVSACWPWPRKGTCLCLRRSPVKPTLLPYLLSAVTFSFPFASLTLLSRVLIVFLSHWVIVKFKNCRSTHLCFLPLPSADRYHLNFSALGQSSVLLKTTFHEGAEMLFLRDAASGISEKCIFILKEAQFCTLQILGILQFNARIFALLSAPYTKVAFKNMNIFMSR